MATKHTTGQRQERPKWVSYIENILGKTMYGDKYLEWLDWMNEPKEGLGRQPKDEEILKALQFGKEKQARYLNDINAEKLIKLIRWYEAEQNRSRYGSSYTSCPLVTQIQSEMRDAHDHAARWDLMCDGAKTVNQCHELDAWAKQEWSDWDESVSEIKRNMSALRKRVWRGCGCG